MIDLREFRDGMASLGAAVHVVTTDGPMGRAGITATAVCSVTDQPPTLLVCVNRGSYTHDHFVGNGHLCVNVLAADQQQLSALFANREIALEHRFELAHWGVLQTGSPVLQDALVSFDCSIAQVKELGSHSILFCQVQAMCRNPAARGGLLYFNRAYHGVGEDPAGCN